MAFGFIIMNVLNLNNFWNFRFYPKRYHQTANSIVVAEKLIAT